PPHLPPRPRRSRPGGRSRRPAGRPGWRAVPARARDGGSPGMIRAWVADLDPATKEPRARAIPPPQSVEAARSGSANVWPASEWEEEATVRTLLAPLEIHPLAIEDMVIDLNRPKVDDFGSYLYIAVHSARWDADRPVLHEIDLLISEHYLVSFHDH